MRTLGRLGITYEDVRKASESILERRQNPTTDLRITDDVFKERFGYYPLRIMLIMLNSL